MFMKALYSSADNEELPLTHLTCRRPTTLPPQRGAVGLPHSLGTNPLLEEVLEK
jgi:hypothetical protein